MNVLEMDRATIADVLDVLAHGRATYDRSREIRDYAAGRIRWSIGAREVYSYGTHFPLLRFVPSRGRRHRPLIVLNGDVWRNGGGPSRTADHQEIARELAGKLGDTCVIPFSALTGAGIGIDSIRPIHTREDETWSETVSAPAHRAPSWVRRERVPVDRTAHTIRGVPPNERYGWRPMAGYGRIVRADDGLYHWTEYVERTVPPDADGLYHWSERRHRLGDCLFSAVRVETYTRIAKPFEASRETARVTIECPMVGDRYCSTALDTVHVAGPSGACVHCGRQLQARVTVRRRGLYLSSFDYNEAPPLYFLAEVPRGSGADTVESAIEALAPRAVHAARARSIPVERQGDVFFIRTALDETELEQRGIVSRARVTQWSHNARARKGEVAYVRPLRADEKRAMARYRVKEWRRVYRDAQVKLAARGPVTEKNARRQWADRRAKHAAELERNRENLRALVFGRQYRPSAPVYAHWGESPQQASRRDLARRVKYAQGNRARLQEASAAIAAGRAIARDSYRAPFRAGPCARVAWSMAGAAARAKFYPHEYHGPTIEKRRETVRRALAIYGTAHTACEVIRTRSGAVYVRGTVRHLPEIEPGRTGEPDHRRLELEPDVWYLAVRNTVPRQSRRRTL